MAKKAKRIPTVKVSFRIGMDAWQTVERVKEETGGSDSAVVRFLLDVSQIALFGDAAELSTLRAKYAAAMEAESRRKGAEAAHKLAVVARREVLGAAKRPSAVMGDFDTPKDEAPSVKRARTRARKAGAGGGT